MRFYDPSSGAVLLDGTDVRKFTLASVRSQITVMLQDTHLFRKTVRENIALGKPGATDDEGHRCRQGGADPRVHPRPAQGYDTLIEGARRELLGRAEAAFEHRPRHPARLADPDPRRADDGPGRPRRSAGQPGAAEAHEGRTTFVIAHRFSTIANADHILVIEEGKIIEEGRHEELLERSTTYRNLYELQHGNGRSTGESSAEGRPETPVFRRFRVSKAQEAPEDCTFPQLATVLDGARFALACRPIWGRSSPRGTSRSAASRSSAFIQTGPELPHHL